jgi:hypothetical protein
MPGTDQSSGGSNARRTGTPLTQEGLAAIRAGVLETMDSPEEVAGFLLVSVTFKYPKTEDSVPFLRSVVSHLETVLSRLDRDGRHPLPPGE